MHADELENLLAQAIQARKIAGAMFHLITGEELDVNSAVRHRPILAICVAAGVGALGGWWLAQRSTVPEVFPPPVHQKSGVQTILESLLGVKPPSVKQEPVPENEAPPPAISGLEPLIAQGVDKVREILPESVAEDVVAVTRTVVEEIIEPKLREGLDAASSALLNSRIGNFLFPQLDSQDTETHDDTDDQNTPSRN